MTSHTIRTAVAAAFVALATTAQAQQDTTVRIDEHWRAYLGCWSSSASGVSGPMICVVPTKAAATVEFMTVVGDSIVARVPVTASGARVDRTREKCSGWESGRWSIDERRLYSHAEYTCPGAAPQQQDGILAMSHADEFVRIEGVKTRSGTRTRVVHFVLEMDSTLYPAEIAPRIPSVTAMPSFAARMEAAANVSTADVADAAKEIDAPLVEAWLGDRRQRFEVAAKDLRAMKSAGVPSSVIDMVVAVSNPDVFTLAQGGTPAAREADPFRTRTGVNRGGLSEMDLALEQQRRMYGAYLPGIFGFDQLYFPFNSYRYNAYGYTYPGFGGFGYGSFGYGGNTPYVIITQPPTPKDPPGRVINGAGYSSGGSSGGSRAEPRSPSVYEGSGGSSFGGGGSSSTGGGGAPAPAPVSSGGGEQRTAKPRP